VTITVAALEERLAVGRVMLGGIEFARRALAGDPIALDVTQVSTRSRHALAADADQACLHHRAPCAHPPEPIAAGEQPSHAGAAADPAAVEAPTFDRPFLGRTDRGADHAAEVAPGSFSTLLALPTDGVHPREGGEYGESHGKATLYVNNEAVADGSMKTRFGKFNLAGDGLGIGRDSGDAVSEDCTTLGEFKNGTIFGVAVTVEKGQYLDLEKLAAAAMAVD
jgi:hypothetical protein